MRSALHQQLDYVAERSGFYRRKYAAEPYRQALARGDLQSLPLTTKAELLQSQEVVGDLVVGDYQAATNSELRRIVCSGATSGQALKIGWTEQDLAHYSEMGARALEIAGVRPDHTVVNCFNYNLYAGGVMDHMAFERLGATVVAYGTGRSRQLLDFLQRLGGQICLYCTPSYGLRLMDVAAESGIDLSSLGVELGVFSGESGLFTSGAGAKLAAGWGMEVRDFYGIAELGVQASSCPHSEMLHFPSSHLVLPALMDPQTLEPLVLEPGQQGELVWTSLNRHACPLIRYRSYDVIRVAEGEQCDCGWSGLRFQHLWRSDDMVKFNGINVYATDIQRLLLELKVEGLTGNFQLQVQQQGLQHRLVVESASGELPGGVEERLLHELKQRLHFTPVISIEKADYFVGNKLKKILHGGHHES